MFGLDGSPRVIVDVRLTACSSVMRQAGIYRHADCG